MIWHPLAALAKVSGLTDIIIIGFYEDAVMSGFVKDSKREFPNINISYLREYRPLGTAGGLYHCESTSSIWLTTVRDSILRAPVPDNIFICNIDICCSFPLSQMMEVHAKHRGVGTILGVDVSRYPTCADSRSNAKQLLNTDVSFKTNLDRFYITWRNQTRGSPTLSTAVSTVGQGETQLTKVFDKSLFDEIKHAMDDKTARAAEDPLVKSDEMLQLEQDVIVPLAAARKMYVYQTREFWRQMKTAA
jgi:mannose-1-phosphate guanylyltransferase